MHPIGGRSGVEDVIVAEAFAFAAALAMADDMTGLGFPEGDAVDAVTSFGLRGGRPRFCSCFDFARLGLQALLGLAFDHLCSRLLGWRHAYLSQFDLALG